MTAETCAQCPWKPDPARRDLTFEWAQAADGAARLADMDLADLAHGLHSLCDVLNEALSETASPAVLEQINLLRRDAANAERRASERRATMKAKQALIEITGLSK